MNQEILLAKCQGLLCLARASSFEDDVEYLNTSKEQVFIWKMEGAMFNLKTDYGHLKPISRLSLLDRIKGFFVEDGKPQRFYGVEEDIVQPGENAQAKTLQTTNEEGLGA